jgi:mannosyltransferase OCH1-like enzyme
VNILMRLPSSNDSEVFPPAFSITQYWHDENVPDVVVVQSRSFLKENPHATHRLFTGSTALEFIEQNYGAREIACFRSCAVPAMQSDYFRLCAAALIGGFYADVDMACVHSLSEIIKGVDSALFYFRPQHWIVPTGFFYVHEPGLPLIRFALEIASENIERQQFDRVWMATGPSIISTVYGLGEAGSLEAFHSTLTNGKRRNPSSLKVLSERIHLLTGGDVSCLLEGICFRPICDLENYVVSRDLSLKNPTAHWTLWPDSIYRS